jgi:pimeloyl-ACP methyl ester carboxylesterase
VKRWLKRIFLALVVLVLGGIALAWTPDGDAAELRAEYGGPASRFVDLGGGLRVHVRDQGKRDGPAVMLIHGSNASLHTWEPWVERLGDRYRIVTLDMPGHGLTGAHPRADYSEAMWVDTIHRVAAALALPRFVIGGNSMGGELAWKYALAHPDRVRGLILIDASGAPGAFPKKLPAGYKLLQSGALKPVVKHLTPRWIIAQSLEDSLAVDSVITPAMVDRYWKLLIYPGNRDATLDRSGFPREDASAEAMARLRMPVLIQWGADDPLFPVRYGEWYARAIPGARFIAYPGVGHIPMEEAPDRTAADASAWLETLAP